MTRLAPDWRPVVLRGVPAVLECERDVNARPGAPARSALRWRRRAFTGERAWEWIAGAPPGARPARRPWREEAAWHCLRVLVAAAIFYGAIVLR